MMAKPAIKYDVTCGVNEEERKKVILMYEVDDPEGRITWEWTHQQKEDGSYQHTAEMTAHDSKRGHKSQPVPDEVYKKLGSPSKKKVSEFFRVKMSRKDEVSVEKYFNG
ncbi:uncharacterized protein [Littorina saxatilis]|uniref:Uncharacterized protein n=1 Tax=Littorina saxatilis TaxID=31220 RepID=A0AAN9AN62_9CAEN|eukprot:GHVL01036574.1.p1 GENE.GHVL01036574.1~~GHVL01036574.1.p1  ORF type:complete len:109 (+),score=24.08 GHVL01036574.1:133-459(+)